MAYAPFRDLALTTSNDTTASRRDASSALNNSAFVFETRGLFDALDSLADDLANDGYLMRLIAGTSIVAAGTLSAGFALWTARTGYLVAMLSWSLPAWASIDPIPVLDADALERTSKRGTNRLDQESLVNIVDGQA